jgi:uncharacterized protein (DUF1810 family)
VSGEDPFRLERFVKAQHGIYAQVLRELGRGRKTSHWMWFIFPQLGALGRSDTARQYGLSGMAEAGAYLAHPELGPRLLECSRLLLALEDQPIADILGHPDDLKLRSCVTLFAARAPDRPEFRAVLDKYYRGEPDPLTLTEIARG